MNKTNPTFSKILKPSIFLFPAAFRLGLSQGYPVCVNVTSGCHLYAWIHYSDAKHCHENCPWGLKAKGLEGQCLVTVVSKALMTISERCFL